MAALSIGLAERGHDVVVALFYDRGQFIDYLKDTGVKLRIVGKSGRWDIFGFLRRLRATIASERPDVICTFLPVPNIMASACKFLQPSLRTIAGVRASRMELSRYGLLTRLIHRAEPYFVGSADLIVSNSKAGAMDSAARGFPVDRLVVISNGIDSRRFRPDTDGSRRLRAEWRIGEGIVLVGLIARLDHMKDHDNFVRAASLIGKRCADVAFVCVGDDGPVSRSNLQQLASELGVGDKFTWITGTNDVSAVFNACDLVCLSSSYGEGFPNVLAEAMACGRRVVSTDVGDSRDIIRDSGIVVPPRDPKALALSLTRMCNEVRNFGTLYEPARRHVIDRFSVDRMVERFEAAIFEFAAPK